MMKRIFPYFEDITLNLSKILNVFLPTKQYSHILEFSENGHNYLTERLNTFSLYH